MKALVVDDSQVMRKVFASALARVGIHEVDEARDGDEAVAKAASGEDYAVVLLDWSLPNRHGMDAFREIRRTGTMPIIVVATEAERERVLGALKFGPAAYLVKPFTPQAILAKLQEVLAWQPA